MRDRPHPNHKLEWPGGIVPEWAKPQQNLKRRGGKGGGPRHERQGGSSPAKRERLQKVMAQSGYGSRRNIEILIAQGHLTINGQVAKLGDSVGPGDKVKLDGNLINLRYGEQLPRVLLYHKPDNEIVTRDDPEKRATVFDRLPKVHGGRWVSVGRLDLNTSGLLMFTTSGELAQRLTHPRFEVEREYAVRLLGELTPEQVDKLTRTGVEIEGDTCTFDSLEDRGGEGANHWYHVVLREGKNREVRKMMEAVGMVVSRLMRVRFGPVALPGHIKRGMFRDMEEEQVQELLAFAGMNEPPPGAEAQPGEDDELENIGNRIDPRRERAPVEIDDDIGNKVNSRHVQHALPEPDGNRGTYIPGGEPAGNRAPKGGPRRPPGGKGKPFAFGKKRPPQHDNIGNVAPGAMPGQGQGHAQGQGHGQGPRHKHRKRGPQAAGQGQGHAPPQPQGAAAPKPPGAGKPGRNRRNKNRNRGRGGGGGGNAGGGNPGGGNAGGGGQQARGDQQPSSNGNRNPY
jgi:23S rRNA pseudouridine2605 synthase